MSKINDYNENTTANESDVYIQETSNGTRKITFSTILNGILSKFLKSTTQSSLTAASKGTKSSREYAVGLDADGEMSVNVPWTDTKTTVVNNLTSTSTTSALSAAQGKYLYSSVISHIGMIIQSTTLDTEAKVKAIYGSDTSWIQHSGYVLRGAASGVTANNATKTGGEDTHTLTVDEIPSHRHSGSTGGTGKVAGYPGSSSDISCFIGAHGNTNYTGGGKAHNNIPNYKSVYIWERIA